MGYIYACVQIPIVDQPAFRASEFPSFDLGNMPASMVELGEHYLSFARSSQTKALGFLGTNFYKVYDRKRDFPSLRNSRLVLDELYYN